MENNGFISKQHLPRPEKTSETAFSQGYPLHFASKKHLPEVAEKFPESQPSVHTRRRHKHTFVQGVRPNSRAFANKANESQISQDKQSPLIESRYLLASSVSDVQNVQWTSQEATNLARLFDAGVDMESELQTSGKEYSLDKIDTLRGIPSRASRHTRFRPGSSSTHGPNGRPWSRPASQSGQDLKGRRRGSGFPEGHSSEFGPVPASLDWPFPIITTDSVDEPTALSAVLDTKTEAIIPISSSTKLHSSLLQHYHEQLEHQKPTTSNSRSPPHKPQTAIDTFRNANWFEFSDPLMESFPKAEKIDSFASNSYDSRVSTATSSSQRPVSRPSSQHRLNSHESQCVNSTRSRGYVHALHPPRVKHYPSDQSIHGVYSRSSTLRSLSPIIAESPVDLHESTNTRIIQDAISIAAANALASHPLSRSSTRSKSSRDSKSAHGKNESLSRPNSSTKPRCRPPPHNSNSIHKPAIEYPTRGLPPIDA